MNSNIEKIQDLCNDSVDYILEEMELAELRDNSERWNALNKLYDLTDVVLMENVSMETYRDVENSINEVLLFESTEDGYSNGCIDALYNLYNACRDLLEGIKYV